MTIKMKTGNPGFFMQEYADNWASTGFVRRKWRTDAESGKWKSQYLHFHQKNQQKHIS